MLMRGIEELEQRMRRDRWNMSFTGVLVVAVLFLIVLGWYRS
jgi:hypothetical protein